MFCRAEDKTELWHQGFSVTLLMTGYILGIILVSEDSEKCIVKTIVLTCISGGKDIYYMISESSLAIHPAVIYL